MAKVRIKDIKQGMVLASPARDPNGRLLLSVGEEITDKLICTFKAWGITEVEIEGNGDEERVTEDPFSEVRAEQVPTQVREEVEELFRYTDRQHPAIKELVESCTLRKMKSH